MRANGITVNASWRTMVDLKLTHRSGGPECGFDLTPAQAERAAVRIASELTDGERVNRDRRYGERWEAVVRRTMSEGERGKKTERISVNL